MKKTTIQAVLLYGVAIILTGLGSLLLAFADEPRALWLWRDVLNVIN